MAKLIQVMSSVVKEFNGAGCEGKPYQPTQNAEKQPSGNC